MSLCCVETGDGRRNYGTEEGFVYLINAKLISVMKDLLFKT
jgi:hypothetical protein